MNKPNLFAESRGDYCVDENYLGDKKAIAREMINVLLNRGLLENNAIYNALIEYAEKQQLDCTYYDSFDDFLKNHHRDVSLNFLFRWDIVDNVIPDGDDRKLQHYLLLFFLQQRKGHFLPVRVAVGPSDNDRIFDWLKPWARYAIKFWSPFL